jgi:type VI secretion system secreted protein VgrG
VIAAASSLFGSTLITSTDSLVKLINVNPSGVDGPDNGIFWQVGSSATIGVGSAFAGNILALTSITLNTGATIDDGRALAINGAVTLDNNRINAGDSRGGFTQGGGSGLTPVPEPGTYALAGLGLLFLVIWRRRVISRGN